MEAAVHHERAAALNPAPLAKAALARAADDCRSRAEAMWPETCIDRFVLFVIFWEIHVV